MARASEKHSRTRSAGSLDLVEIRLKKLLQDLHDAYAEIGRLQEITQQADHQVTEAVAEKQRELDDKEKIVRRQQNLIKTKDAAYQELQDAYNALRREADELKRGSESTAQTVEIRSEPKAMLDPEFRTRMRVQLESVLNKINELEKII